MTEKGQGGNSFDASPDAQLGGADDVQKTTYVTGRGTDPEARRKGAGSPSAGGRLGAGAWVLIAVAVAIALFFAARAFG